MTRGIIGAVLAGGQSTRYGSDKALAVAFGRPLIVHAIECLRRITPDIVICGREYGDLPWVADRPARGLGPLCGLNAALHYARAHDVPWVLSLACDTPAMPADFLTSLTASAVPRFAADHPVIGFWPSSAADQLDQWLEAGHRSMRGWTEAIGATPHRGQSEIPNINTPLDLDDWLAGNTDRRG